MGLDQWAYTVHKRYRKNSITLNREEEIPEGSLEEIKYWRKNRHIHNWMKNLYIKKCKKLNVEPRNFNTDIVFLNKKDLLSLQKDIMLNKLPDTAGFFWGDGEYTEDQAASDLKFVANAIKALDNDPNMRVFYTSWW